MDYIEYDQSINKEEFIKRNICLDEKSFIADGVKLYNGVSVIGESRIGEGCQLYGYSVIENVNLGKNVVVKSSMLSGVNIGDNSTIGPYANIHSGSVIGKGCRIGNFVEIKKSIIGDGNKIAHLTYVGDAEIGNDCNIGCGVVFCNYNGRIKQKSYIGDKVFIGSNVNIIAPVIIADGAYIAAGSTVNKDVDVDEFVIARARQINKKNFHNPYKNK